MLTVHIECVLDCPAEKVWQEVQQSALLLEVVEPLAHIKPVDSAKFPQAWIEGETVRCKSYLFGVIPLGTRTIRLERIDQAAHEIQSRERDQLIDRWDHLIRVAATRDGRTRYSDEIVIEAGVATRLVWLFAHLLYRHRQRKWQHVARRLAAI